jgi:hypothetical protein
MNSKGFSTISISVKTEIKDLFLKLFDESGVTSKSDFFSMIIKKFAELDNAPGDPLKEFDTLPAVEPLEEGNLNIALNFVQDFALTYPFETIPNFLELANKEVLEMNARKDFWTDKQKFPGFFIEYDQAKGINHNKAAFLVNVFMACIAKRLIPDIVPLKEIQKAAYQYFDQDEV